MGGPSCYYIIKLFNYSLSFGEDWGEVLIQFQIQPLAQLQ